MGTHDAAHCQASTCLKEGVASGSFESHLHLQETEQGGRTALPKQNLPRLWRVNKSLSILTLIAQPRNCPLAMSMEAPSRRTRSGLLLPCFGALLCEACVQHNALSIYILSLNKLMCLELINRPCCCSA
eukprot:2278946-Amphidinium_carterae.1